MNCRICKNKITNVSVLANANSYLHCDYCGFTGLDPEFFLSSDDEKARYDLHENSIENLGYVKMFEDFISYAITPYKDSISSVIDYGSGPGPVLAELLTSKGYKVDVYDPYYAPRDFTADSFDLLTATEVLEHIYDPVTEIKKMLRLVKTNGYLAFMTRFMPELDKFKSWFYKDDDTHVSFYSLKTFEFLAKELGFELVKQNDLNIILLRKN